VEHVCGKVQLPDRGVAVSRKKRKPKKSARADKAGGKKRPAGKKGGEQKPSDGKPDDGKADAGKSKDKGKQKQPKSAARNLVETIATVVVLVLVIRYFFLEAFKIPSSSMEPTLIGHPYHGDRVLAWKPSVKWTEPDRWSVNVFVKHPDECERQRGDEGDKNYIKRLIGLPGERVLIAGGDIYVQKPESAEAEIARKPPALQEDVWHAVYEGSDLEGSWKLDAGLRCARPSAGRRPDDTTRAGEAAGVTVIEGEADGQAWARFARNRYDGDNGLVTNLYVKKLRLRFRCPHKGCGEEFKESIRTSRTRLNCPSCGRKIDVLRDDARVVKKGKRPWFPEFRDDEVPVGDLRVSFDVTPETPRGFVLAELTRDDERYVARVPIAGGTARISGPYEVESHAEVVAFGPGKTRRVSFAHVDHAAVLALDGEEIARVEYPLSWTERAGTPAGNAVRIGLEDAKASLGNPHIERDLHYLARGSESIVGFYSRERGRGRWLDLPAATVPGLPPRVGSAAAIRTREKLGDDEYFFMGDNSASSYDGRMWGSVAKGDMVGRAFFLFWPPHQVRRLH
jgi:signal peptidase I